jgi:tetratricopeptide (TPR) repeat protein
VSAGLLVILLLRIAAAPDDRAQAARLAAEADATATAGDLGRAVALMEQAEAVAPQWAELKVNLASLRSRAGDHAGAISAARAALALSPGLAGARFNLGLAQLKSGDAAGAAATLAPYASDRRAPSPVLVALGLSLIALDRSGEAVVPLSLAVEAGVRDPPVLFALARAWRAAGRPERAEPVEQMLDRSAPGSAAALLLRGDALDRARDWAGAEAEYRRAVAADPRFPGAQHSLGLMLYKRRDYDAAARAFDAELSAAPAYAPSLHYRALLELDRGQAAAARPLLERAVAAAPGRQEAWRDLGRAWLELGRLGEAEAALRKAVELRPDDANAHFLLGRTLQRAGRAAEAAAAFRRAAQLNRRLREELQDAVSGPDR